MMNTCTITKSHRNNRARPRWGANGRYEVKTVVYCDSNLVNLADKFFTDNEIYKLSFKCKAWTKVGNAATKKTAEIISEKLGHTFKYSHKAGCSCGCSPGYVAYIPGGAENAGHSIWAKVEADDSGLKDIIEKAKPMLDLEIKNHS